MATKQPYILLIDDDPDDIEMISSALIEIGVSVKPFESSSKALYFLDLVSGNKDWPALIIMDYNMPKKNGYDVLVLLRSNPEFLSIPVLIYSTTINPMLREKLLNAGAAGCFNKSATYKELIRQVRSFDKQFIHFHEC